MMRSVPAHGLSGGIEDGMKSEEWRVKSVPLGDRATSHSHCVSISLSKIPERETQAE